MYQFFPYIILLIFSFIMMVSLAMYGLRYRDNLGGKEFIFAMLASAWWVFCQAFELMAVTLPVKLFWASIEYLGVVCGFAYLMLAIKFSGYERLLTKRNICIVFMIYAVFFSLVFTDTYHGLMRTNFSLDTSAIPYILHKDYGVIYPIYILFTYSINVASLVLLFITAIKKDSIYKKQAVILFAGLGLIAVSNISYILGLSPVKRFDIAPALFGLSALVVSWGIFQHKLLNIMPIARDLLVERLNSGVIVGDRNNALVDINHTALIMFNLEKPAIIGKNISEIPILAKNLPVGIVGEQQTTIAYQDGDKEVFYDIKTIPLNDKREKTVGTLYVLNDITEQQKNLQRIIKHQKTLSVMRERERLGRELHDGLGQVFGYINAQAQTVKEYMLQNNSKKVMEQLNKLIRVARDAHGGIREYILEMRGIAPRNRSFSATLKQYAESFSEKHGIPVTVSFDDDLPLFFPEDEKAVQILKMIQEALNNTKKHAGPCDVNISFIAKEWFVEVRIYDNGKGFDIGKLCGVHQYGLSIIRERAAEIGSDIEINSKQGAGTEIILRIWGEKEK